MNRILKTMLALYVGKRLYNRLNPASRPAGTAAPASGAITSDHYKPGTRYGKDSDLLWERGKLDPRYKVRYQSDWVNRNGEPVFYRRGEEPWIVSPDLHSGRPGCFRSNPGGLQIDPVTGQVDINHSDTGIRYEVEFAPCGRKGVARTTLVMGGIGYEGTLSSLSGDQPLVARPHYFGHDPELEVPSYRVPAGRYGYIPDQVKPTADLKGLAIDEGTGEIDLRKTVLGGALGYREGGRLPENGASKDFRVYYQAEGSPGREALNYTSLRIHFYDTEADIPEDLLVRIRQQRNSIFQRGIGLPLVLGLPYAWTSDGPWDVLATLAATLTGLFLLNIRESNHPMRPPEHVVTG